MPSQTLVVLLRAVWLLAQGLDVLICSAQYVRSNSYSQSRPKPCLPFQELTYARSEHGAVASLATA